jgi:hypothetical protein
MGIRLSGRVTAEDYDVLLPHLDKAIAASGRVNMLVLMRDFEGWAGLEPARADCESGTDQYRHVEKAAFVSKQKWLEWAVWIMDPFIQRTHERFFRPAQLEEAWQWIREE